MIDKLPNNGIEMDVKKLPLKKTTYTQSLQMMLRGMKDVKGCFQIDRKAV
jgi:hypothetical protein